MVTAYESLSRALELNAGKSTRSEDLEDFSDYLADPVGLASIAGNANAVIFGRRGAGKTLVLGALVDEVNSGLVGPRVLAFRYSADTFRTSPQFSTHEPTVKEEARVFFNAFLHSLMVDLSEAGTARLYEDARWTTGLTRKGQEARERREEFLSLLAEYDELVRFGVSPGEPVDVKQTLTHTMGATRSTDGSLGGSLGGKVTDPVPRVHGKVSHGRTKSNENTGSMEVTLERRFAPASIRELIVRTIEFMDLDYIIIAIDEWMTLGESQTEFAERLRRTLFGDRRIAVKIATDQYQSLFNNGASSVQMRGFELGADVIVATDLDVPFSDPNKREALFALALYKRLLKFQDTLSDWYGPQDAKFISALFSGRQAFAELCLASNGLCREFFVLFRLCTKELGFKVARNRRIDIDTVRKAILDNYRSTYSRAVELPTKFLLFEVIMRHLRTVQSRFFLVPNAVGGMSNPAIRDLLAKRFIVLMAPTELHEGLSAEYTCFGLEYGMYVEMMRTIEYSTGRGIDDAATDDVLQITPANALAFVLDLSTLGGLSPADSAICASCGASYLVSDRHVTKLGVCPYCLEGVSSDGKH